MAVRHPLAADERETVITMSDGFKRATVYSEQRSVVTKIQRLAERYPEAVTIYRQGKHASTHFIEADVPAAFIGLRPAKFSGDAINGHPSPVHAGADT